MRNKIVAFLCSLILTLFLTGVCFAEGGPGGEPPPSPPDPKCQSIVIGQ